MAVPAYAGAGDLPGGGDTITLVRGYEDESRMAPDIDWASLARLDGTIVCYAGSHQLLHITDALLAHGWTADEPVVVVYNGTLPSQDTIATTIGDLRERLSAHPAARSRDSGHWTGGWFPRSPAMVRRAAVVRPTGARHPPARTGA